MHTSLTFLVLLTALLGGCVSVPLPANRSGLDPSNPSAPEASAQRFRPKLVATTKTYLDPALGQGAGKMGMSKMEGTGKMDHSKMQGMEGMDHSKMSGMDMKQPSAAPPNKEALEKEMKQTSDEMKKLSDELKAKSDAAKGAEPSSEKAHAPAKSTTSASTGYTCPMHPEINEAKPGNCPICGMTLIKKSAQPERAKP